MQHVCAQKVYYKIFSLYGIFALYNICTKYKYVGMYFKLKPRIRINNKN